MYVFVICIQKIVSSFILNVFVYYSNRIVCFFSQLSAVECRCCCCCCCNCWARRQLYQHHMYTSCWRAYVCVFKFTIHIIYTTSFRICDFTSLCVCALLCVCVCVHAYKWRVLQHPNEKRIVCLLLNELIFKWVFKSRPKMNLNFILNLCVRYFIYLQYKVHMTMYKITTHNYLPTQANNKNRT